MCCGRRVSLPRCTSSWCTRRSASSPTAQHTQTQSYSTLSSSCGSRLVSYYFKIHDLFLASKLDNLGSPKKLIIFKCCGNRIYLLRFRYRFRFRLYNLQFRGNLSSVSMRTFVIPFYYGSNSAKAKSYGTYGPSNALCFVLNSFHVF